jgi:DNA-binding MurR/RpiR family transcriptional regulator
MKNNYLKELIILKYIELTKAEKKAADFLLAYEGGGKEISMKQFAKEAGISEPTVMRFVKALGFKSFQEMKYYMVAEQAFSDKHSGTSPLYGYSIREKEAANEIPGKVLMTTKKMLDGIFHNLSIHDYEKVIQMIKDADKIDIYSVENSNSVSWDLATKLLYLGLNCRMFQDSYLQKICANNLTSKDLVIGISYSGSSIDTVDAVKLAKKRNAKVIVMTNFENTRIARYADVVLKTSDEQLFYGDAIFSRSTQIALVDMIYMGIIQSDFEKYTKILESNSKIIINKAYGMQPKEK